MDVIKELTELTNIILTPNLVSASVKINHIISYLKNENKNGKEKLFKIEHDGFYKTMDGEKAWVYKCKDFFPVVIINIPPSFCVVNSDGKVNSDSFSSDNFSIVAIWTDEDEKKLKASSDAD